MREPVAHATADEASYALLDAARGRRIERFGRYVVDRPSGASPAWEPLHADLPDADLVFERTDAGGRWTRGGDVQPWHVTLHGLTLELRPAAGGQVGVFPEHASLWPWLDEAVRAAADRLGRRPAILSLFGYTGGASLAMARAGAEVAHVDASRPAVAWARANAARSGLADAPIRWLVDGAAAFVARERRRNRRYDGVVLDPPSYGHAPGGRDWRIATDLPPLLADVTAIVPEPAVILLTTHSLGWDERRLTTLVGTALGVDAEAGPLELHATSGRVLELGAFARFAS